MTEEDVPNTTFLKWVVSVLGILIVGVAVVLIVTVYKRMENTAENVTENTAEPTPAMASEVSATGNFGTLEIPMQKDLQVQDIKQSNDNVLVIYGDADRTPRKIIVLNPTTGKIVGQVILK